MCKCRLLILFLFSLFIAVGTKAQKRLHYFFQHITRSDGLLPTQVFAIVQDSKGFIWIASIDGLQRYDGSRFNYFPELLNTPAEQFISGAEMYSDKKNNSLWLQKNAAVEKMELTNYRFRIYDSSDILKDPAFQYSKYSDAN